MNKQSIALFLFIIMIAGLFWSRAVLSLSQGAWAIYAIWQYKTWWPNVKKDILLIWSVCPLLLFLLGWYQQPTKSANFDFLLTLFVYPIAAISIESITEKTKLQFIKVWQWAIVIGLLYPIGWYLFHITESYIAYGAGQSLPTFMESDHIRFSIFLCGGVLFSILTTNSNSLSSRWILLVLIICIVFLSVRTAWFILFIFLVLSIIYRFRNNKRLSIKNGILFVVICFTLFISLYFIFPTVQQKIAYTIFDWQQYTPEKYQSNFSDGVRRAVNHSAITAIQSGGSNIGWAGIPETLEHYFKVNYPTGLLQYGRPFNQWLYWWMGSGWWGMFLFSLWLFFPFYWGWKNNCKGVTFWTAAIILSCFVESNLTFQFGVFLHAWPIAILWKMRKGESNFAEN